MSNHLERSDLAELRQTLLERRTALLEEIRSQLDNAGEESYAELAGQLRDLGDEAAADVLLDTRLADIERDVREVEAIREALTRIDQGGYGVCVDCGEDIALERLKAQPTAQRCIRCQEIWERMHADEHPREL